LYPLAQYLLDTYNNAGRKLRELQKKDFGDLITSFIRSSSSSSSSSPSAVNLCVFLSKTFESFQDIYNYRSREVTFGRVQHLIGELYCLFKNENSNTFGFTDIDELTAIADETLIKSLQRSGVLQIEKDREEEERLQLLATVVNVIETLVIRSKETSHPFNALALDRTLGIKPSPQPQTEESLNL
jgi:hypothetical protein